MHTLIAADRENANSKNRLQNTDGKTENRFTVIKKDAPQITTRDNLLSWHIKNNPHTL